MSEARRLIENLQTDLRGLSNEAKKKHSAVRDASESCLVKVKNMASAPGTEEELIGRLRGGSSELLHPFLLACGTRQPRLANLALASIHRIVMHQAADFCNFDGFSASGGVIVKELWSLAEAEVEELKVLQTVQLLVSTPGLVQDASLAKCLVLCLRLRMAKDPVVINTASASVRQLVGQVFERATTEAATDGAAPEAPPNPAVHSHPNSLKPAAKDAYMLFQDLCLLVGGERAAWLPGLTSIDRALGLELLDGTLLGFHDLFIQRSELSWLVKESVCPLVIKLFSPSLKAAESPDRPSFPILMRLLRLLSTLVTAYYVLLVTECEIFLSLIIKFLEGEKAPWQRALALEVLHRVAATPPLLARICANYDLRPHATNVLQDILNALGGYVATVFARPPSLNRGEEEDAAGASKEGAPGFLFRRTWLPLSFVAPQGTPKALFLELMDKHEAPPVGPGYCLSLAYAALTDATHSVADVVHMQGESHELAVQMLRSSYCGILNALSLLLEASCDENITERLLKSLGILVGLACELGEAGAREGCLGSLCRSALPPRYLARIIPPSSFPNAVPVWEREAAPSEAGGSPSNVVAMGTPCPTPWLPPQLGGTQLVLTAKNLQALRSLLGTASVNGAALGESWHLVLATLQHVAWILGLRPALGGGWKTGGGPSDSVLTTAVLADVPVLGALLNKLFDLSSELDEVSLHHVIGGLVKLSGDSLVVAGGGREPSFFGPAKLLHVGLVNLHRLPTFWKPLTAQLLELCAQAHAGLREWGAAATVALVNAAFAEAKLPDGYDRERLELLMMLPLAELCETSAEDVRRLQIDCLQGLLRARSTQLRPKLWPVVVGILADIPAPHHAFGESVVKAGFGAVAFILSDCLPCLPDLDCLRHLIEVDAKFGGQQGDLNTSLSAVGQLWTISDALFRRHGAERAQSGAELEKLWLCLYTALSDLCVDPRPPVRKSACQTLLQTAASHGATLLPHTWQLMLWNVLFPIVERVRALHGGASTEKMAPGSGGPMLIHHSRDTEAKQWAETSSTTLAAIVRIFNAQRGLLLGLSDFERAWGALLGYIRASASSSSVEVSLQGLKSFLELLVGREDTKATPMPPLPPEAWDAAWQTWLEVGESLCGLEATGAVVTREPGAIPIQARVGKPAHLTTFMHLFPPLFAEVGTRLSASDWARWGAVLEGVVSLPVASEDAPFILPTHADVTPTQEAVLTALGLVYEQGAKANSKLRGSLPQLFQLLVLFASFAVKGPANAAPSNPAAAAKGGKTATWVAQNYVPFSELCLRRLVEFYSNTAHLTEVIQAGTLTIIVQCLGLPMGAKYACPAQSTWKLAVTSLLTLLRLALPIARQHPKHFKSLWGTLADTLEAYLFPASAAPDNLSPEEQRKQEFLDCEVVEVIRSQLLPHSATLPPAFLTRLIGILNRGSLALPAPSPGGDVPSRDVLGVGPTTSRQRPQLSRACFQALLAMSSAQPDLVRGAGGSSCGTEAVLSLLSRARQVVSGFMGEEAARGEVLPLSKAREAEMESVLAALLTLMSSVQAASAEPEVWEALIALYPLLVDCIPTRSVVVRTALMSALKAYAPLLSAPK